jgi:hypothetical protein
MTNATTPQEREAALARMPLEWSAPTRASWAGRRSGSAPTSTHWPHGFRPATTASASSAGHSRSVVNPSARSRAVSRSRSARPPGVWSQWNSGSSAAPCAPGARGPAGAGGHLVPSRGEARSTPCRCPARARGRAYKTTSRHASYLATSTVVDAVRVEQPSGGGRGGEDTGADGRFGARPALGDQGVLTERVD